VVDFNDYYSGIITSSFFLFIV
jgi:hypothetical protein